MKTPHTPGTDRLRQLALPLLAGLLLVLVAGGPVRAAAPSRASHPASPSHALSPAPTAPAVLGGAVATSASHVQLYASDLASGSFGQTQWNGSAWSGWYGIDEDRNRFSWTPPLAVTQDQAGPSVFGTSPAPENPPDKQYIYSQEDRLFNGGCCGLLPATYNGQVVPVVSAPAAVSWGGSRLDVIAWSTLFGQPVLLHLVSNDDGAFYSWDTSPPLANADPTLQPTIVSRGVNSLDIFALGTDHALYYLNGNGSTWGQWQSLGGYLLYGHVAALPMSASQLEVYGIGSDGGLYRQVLTYVLYWPVWSGWQYLGGSLIQTAPTVVAWGGGNRTACLLGGDNALWCADGYGLSSPTWSWYSLGGYFAPSVMANTTTVALPPVSVTADAATVMVFAIDPNGEIWANTGFAHERNKKLE